MTEVVAGSVAVGNRVAMRSLPEGWTVQSTTTRPPEPPVSTTSDQVVLRTPDEVTVSVRAAQLGDGGTFRPSFGHPLPPQTVVAEVRGHPAERTTQDYALSSDDRRSVGITWFEDPHLSITASAITADPAVDVDAVLTAVIDSLQVSPLRREPRRAEPAELDAFVPASAVRGTRGIGTLPVVATTVHGTSELRVASHIGGRDGSQICLGLVAPHRSPALCTDLSSRGQLVATALAPPFPGSDLDLVLGFAPAHAAAVRITIGAHTQEVRTFRRRETAAETYWVDQLRGALADLQSEEGLKAEAVDVEGRVIQTLTSRSN